MTQPTHADAPALRGGGWFHTVSLAAVAAAVLLAGCGEKKDKPATQTAAKVNKEEITVHQINYVLQQQRGLTPESAASASKQILDRLVDQELAVQKAAEQKLDRDPRVVQQLEAARREIISRAYLEKIGSGAPKPSPAEVQKYYDDNPALFKERRVYNFQEIGIQAAPDKLPLLREKLQAAKDLNEFVAFLKASEIKYSANQLVRGAEQLPLASVANFAKMKDGSAVFNTTPAGAQVVFLAASRTQPVDVARATPAIEAFLLNERKRKVIEDDLKALRTAAKIEYVGQYAKGASGPGVDKAEVVESKSALTGAASGAALVESTAPAAMPAPMIEKETPVAPGASAPAGSALDKGLKGFK